MDGLYLGIELSDTGCSIAVIDSQTKKVQTIAGMEKETLIPCLLCYDMEEDRWTAGAMAEEYKDHDNCIILYKLVTLLKSRQELRLNEVTYTSDELMGIYLRELIEWAGQQFDESRIVEIAVCLDHADLSEKERLTARLSKMGYKSGHIHILNRQECFMHYIMSQNRELWTNASYLMDYGEEGLNIYRLSLKKNGLKTLAIVKQDSREDCPSVKILHQSKETEENADMYFNGVIEQLLRGQIVNSFLLSGTGFQNLEWAVNAIHTAAALKSRKIYQVNAVYCMGAACAAYHMYDESGFPYIAICEDHVSVDVSLYTDGRNGRNQVLLVSCGSGFQEARAHMNLLLEDENELVLFVKNAGASDNYKQRIDLSPIMSENQDRIRIALNVAFVNDHEMYVQITDLGFGEFFPASDQVITQKFTV